ncbi:putative amidohydrolase [Ruminiclostridium sufflavum DSM 19573]|uniref:Putative amidohydrolase n=1 Tax=Ruminiclostridium sufflavum DSM 19573 TaxID=1121337 RepID=A0A318XXP4_9FIRM|nr:carbon-nitrogen hydrolase family protein [Ruminiclostridium sufflavum]PYG87567.1 putative amidohydrolase [Ruminiclostridium sufflavum DSM 19573]
MNNIRLGLCQMKVTGDKQYNLEKAARMIEECKDRNANIAVLPEMFTCPYGTQNFPLYAEELRDSETLSVISKAAEYNDIYVIAGSIPELDKERYYNTCAVFDRTGKIIGRHRKIHLFDIDIRKSISFKESDVLSCGNKVTVVDTEYCKIGIAICFDMRFCGLYSEMCKAGAKIIITPGAFNMITGPAHWELLVRARALDNQLFHAAVSPARDNKAGYIAYGNSMVCDPWGTVISRADENEQVIISEINLDLVDSIRKQIPVAKLSAEKAN